MISILPTDTPPGERHKLVLAEHRSDPEAAMAECRQLSEQLRKQTVADERTLREIALRPAWHRLLLFPSRLMLRHRIAKAKALLATTDLAIARLGGSVDHLRAHLLRKTESAGGGATRTH